MFVFFWFFVYQLPSTFVCFLLIHLSSICLNSPIKLCMFFFPCVLYVGSISICFCVCKLLCVGVCVSCVITNVYVSVVCVYCLVSYVFLTLIVIESLNNYQASRPHNSGSIHVWKNFMAKLGALSISNMVQKLCSNMFDHFVINARFCYYKVGHFANILWNVSLKLTQPVFQFIEALDCNRLHCWTFKYCQICTKFSLVEATS
jgi:hypothetical protein